MRTSRLLAGLATLTFMVAGFAGSSRAPAQDSADQQLGTVHFETSCNEAAQRRFDRAMRYQHSFWYEQSGEIFQGALEKDPTCAIAYWGIALSLLHNPHSVPNPEDQPRGLDALKKAQAVGAKTQRERDYIDSLMVLYADYDKVPRDTRVQNYLKAVEQLAARYPDDDEAQINYAITLNVAASPKDKTYANQLKGAAILEPIFKRKPQHPGVAHYLIHLYDYPAIASKGLDAALRYAKIAPAAPHAQHMPSHIFTRVGYWKDSIASNQASAEAAVAGKEWDEKMHASDYMVYAYLQLGRDQEASDVIAQMKATTGYDRPAGDFAMAASPRPLRHRAWRLEGGGRARREAKPLRLSHRDLLLRPRSWIGPLRRRGCGARRSRQARRTRRQAQRCLLGRPGRHPAADRRSLGARGRG